MHVDVGSVYLGVPVYFEVTTSNICNLPAAYKLERPGGATPAYTLVFDQPEGPLGAKEKVTVQAAFTAYQPGPIEDIIANKIRGVAVPLGFVLTGEALSPLADCVYLGQDTESASFLSTPAPLAHPSLPRYPTDTDTPPLPSPLPPPTLDFGADVSLYERKKAKFCIRNLSPVPMALTITALKFSVKGGVTAAALSGDSEGGGGGAGRGGSRKSKKMGTSTRGTAATGTGTGTAGGGHNPDGKVLIPREDGANKFHSVDGRKYAEASVQRRENRLFLTSGLGASYLIDCGEEEVYGEGQEPGGERPQMQVYLEPWGVKTAIVRILGLHYPHHPFLPYSYSYSRSCFAAF